MLLRSMGVDVGELRLELRPDIAAESFRLDRAEDRGQAEHFGRLCETHDVVDEGLTIDAGDSEQHLWLVIDKRHDTIVWREQPLFTSFCE